MTDTLPAHSPLGASSAERWMNCVGSVALIRTLDFEDTDDPDYRRLGTAAHAALASCLEGETDAWEAVGQEYEGETVDVEMSDAIQVMLDHVRPMMKGADKVYVEYKMWHSDFHPSFFGTVDFAAVRNLPPGWTLDVADYKHGEGVAVEVEWNPQIMYYAYGILRDHPEITKVRLHIVQPRIAWHPGGTVRTWEIDADVIVAWADGTLKPAMERAAAGDGGYKSGDWCRFCPAKLACPLLIGLFGAAAMADPEAVGDMSDEQIDREYPLVDGVKQYLKALEAAAYSRLNSGREFDSIKLVRKKANRVWTPEALALFTSRYGDQAYQPPAFKSPAEMEKLGGPAKELVREYSHTPESGLTVALSTDKRVGVKVTSVTEAFAGVVNVED